jgi:torulene dioxygenase
VRILYSSRSQVDGLVEKIRETGNFHTYTFAQKRDPCQGILGKLFSVFARSIPRRGAEKNGTALILESDFSMTKELDYETLEPIGIANQSSLRHLLKGPLSCAHSATDRDNGDVFNYNLDFGRYATYRVFRVNAGSGIIDILTTITGPNTSRHISLHFFSLRML